MSLPRISDGSGPASRLSPGSTFEITPLSAANALSHFLQPSSVHRTIAQRSLNNESNSHQLKPETKPVAKRYEPRNYTKRAGSQSMVDRLDPDYRYLHGAAGYQHCERLTPAHRWRTRNQSRRSNLGADQLPGGKRRGSSPQCMAEPGIRPQELLHGLRGPLHAQLVLVRGGSEPWTLNFFPSAAGGGWGRLGSFGTGDAGGHLSASQTRSRLWTLQHGYCVSAGTRTDPGWVDNR